MIPVREKNAKDEVYTRYNMADLSNELDATHPFITRPPRKTKK
jgi:hypothetical protein